MSEIKKNALKFNEDNKDKPYCQGWIYIGSGRGGVHEEICANRDKCSKYKEWLSAGKPITNHDEHVAIHICSARLFRKCFLYNV